MDRKIRAAAVAKHIGISSQDLRKLLSEVNFGVKPTDREFAESLAAGIVRFASRKYKRDIPPLINYDDDDIESENEEEKDTLTVAKVREEAEENQPENAFQAMNRLGKKSTDEELPSVNPAANAAKNKEDEKKTAVSPAIFRKIEVDPTEAAAAKERHLEKERLSKEEREQDLIEKKAMDRRKKKSQVLVRKEGVVEIPPSISIKEFSEKIGVPAAEIISVLLKNGLMVTMTQSVDFDTLSIIAADLDVEIKKEERQGSAADIKSRNLNQLLADDVENLIERPPVIVVMGHVDHGKTKILDVIRETKVVEGEAGGITQHIGAYQVTKSGKKITFIDTPGHEAFTSMRARGARIADVAILVVAADEGVKPQTIEALNHAREAELPIIVALNKIDKPDANIDKIKGELAGLDLAPEDWGGKTPTVLVSALQKKGIDDLLEIILLQSELLELKANPNRLAVGTVVESNLNSSLGPVATIIINTGTLSIGDDFVLDGHAGRIKTMIDDNGEKLTKALPGTPIRISGLDAVPAAGGILQVYPSAKAARQQAEEMMTLLNEEKASGAMLSDIMAGLQQGKIKFLKIVLKADTEGSLEAVRQAIEKIESQEVAPKVIHAAVGSVTETDVMMAAASQGVVLGFNVLSSPRVKRIAENEKVEVQNYDIIYNLVDDVKKILFGLLEPEILEIITGQVDVKQIFFTKKKMAIVGCKVRKGFIENGGFVRLFRGEPEEGVEQEPVGIGKIASLQHFENKVPRVEENQECGIQFEGKISVEEGDRLEAYKLEERMKTL